MDGVEESVKEVLKKGKDARKPLPPLFENFIGEVETPEEERKALIEMLEAKQSYRMLKQKKASDPEGELVEYEGEVDKKMVEAVYKEI